MRENEDVSNGEVCLICGEELAEISGQPTMCVECIDQAMDSESDLHGTKDNLDNLSEDDDD